MDIDPDGDIEIETDYIADPMLFEVEVEIETSELLVSENTYTLPEVPPPMLVDVHPEITISELIVSEHNYALPEVPHPERPDSFPAKSKQEEEFANNNEVLGRSSTTSTKENPVQKCINNTTSFDQTPKMIICNNSFQCPVCEESFENTDMIKFPEAFIKHCHPNQTTKFSMSCPMCPFVGNCGSEVLQHVIDDHFPKGFEMKCYCGSSSSSNLLKLQDHLRDQHFFCFEMCPICGKWTTVQSEHARRCHGVEFEEIQQMMDVVKKNHTIKRMKRKIEEIAKLNCTKVVPRNSRDKISKKATNQEELTIEDLAKIKRKKAAATNKLIKEQWEKEKAQKEFKEAQTIKEDPESELLKVLRPTGQIMEELLGEKQTNKLIQMKKTTKFSAFPEVPPPILVDVKQETEISDLFLTNTTNKKYLLPSIQLKRLSPEDIEAIKQDLVWKDLDCPDSFLYLPTQKVEEDQEFDQISRNVGKSIPTTTKEYRVPKCLNKPILGRRIHTRIICTIPFKCPVCGEIFDNTDMIKFTKHFIKHCQIDQTPEFTASCPMCPFVGNCGIEVLQHVIDDHLPKGLEMKCYYCYFSCSNLLELQDHLKLQAFLECEMCPICGKWISGRVEHVLECHRADFKDIQLIMDVAQKNFNIMKMKLKNQEISTRKWPREKNSIAYATLDEFIEGRRAKAKETNEWVKLQWTKNITQGRLFEAPTTKGNPKNELAIEIEVPTEKTIEDELLKDLWSIEDGEIELTKVQTTKEKNFPPELSNNDNNNYQLETTNLPEMRVDDNPWSCRDPLCRISSAENHDQIHHSMICNPFDCPVCQHRFEDIFIFIEHFLRECAKEVTKSSSSCPICSFQGLSGMEVAQHVISKHISEDIEMECFNCSFAHSRFSVMKDHLKMYHPFDFRMCNICGKWFQDLDEFNFHLYIDHGAQYWKYGLQ